MKFYKCLTFYFLFSQYSLIFIIINNKYYNNLSSFFCLTYRFYIFLICIYKHTHINATEIKASIRTLKLVLILFHLTQQSNVKGKLNEKQEKNNTFTLFFTYKYMNMSDQSNSLLTRQLSASDRVMPNMDRTKLINAKKCWICLTIMDLVIHLKISN